jgi:NADH-quinone oxidoreductase subunit H
VTPELKGFILLSSIKITVVFSVMMLAVALTTLAERRISAFKQDRLGPNRVGPQGLFQPIADGIKNFVKEELIPAQATKLLFVLAPAISYIPAALIFAVIPFAAPMPVNFDFTLPLLGRFVHSGPTPMMIADLPIGMLFIVAISSLAVYGIVLAGWSSANKYSLLGGLRASAQMVSYEVAFGFSFIGVLMLSGNVTLPEIVAEQQGSVWFQPRRDQPAAVRPPRNGIGAGDGVPHGIQLDEVRHVLHGRVHAHHHRRRARRDALLRRVGHSLHVVGLG